MKNGPIPSFLRIELLSDATFSRGEGSAGVVDIEVERDEFGMPFIGGKTVRGLLRGSWLSMWWYDAEGDKWRPHFPRLVGAAERVLGRSQVLDESCRLRIGDAILPAPIGATIRRAIEPRKRERRLLACTILDGFTTIRYQTAENRETGAPEAATLRSSRVVLRGFAFVSRLTWLAGYQPTEDDVQVLALCALATRHGGLLRNRGRGHIRITLNGDIELTRKYAKGSA